MHSVWGGRHACAACCQGVRGRASLPDKSCASDGAEGTHLTLWRASDTGRVAAREAPLVCATVCGMPQGRDATHTLPHTLSQHASPTYTLNLARDTWHATEPLSASHVLAILPPGHLPSSAPQLLAPCGCQFQQASLRLAAASSERDTNRLPNHSTTKPLYYQTTLLPHRSATNPTLLPNNSATNPTLLPNDSTTKPLYVLPNDPTTKPLYYQTALLPHRSTTKPLYYQTILLT